MAKSAKKSVSSSNNILTSLKESESMTSIIFGAIVVIVVGILLFNYTSSNRQALLSEKGETTELNETNNPVLSLPATYLVIAGDSLWKIAEKYYGSGYNWVDIAKANKLGEKDGLRVGMSLNIPVAEVIKASVPVKATAQITTSSYQVVAGDSLWNIAVRAYGDGYKWTSILKANAGVVKNPNMLFVGWTLTLPR